MVKNFYSLISFFIGADSLFWLFSTPSEKSFENHGTNAFQESSLMALTIGLGNLPTKMRLHRSFKSNLANEDKKNRM